MLKISRYAYSLLLASCISQMAVEHLSALKKSDAAVPVELKKHHQPFAFFKTTGKYPTITKYYPATSALHTILCGTHDQERHVFRSIQTPEEIENLRALRALTLYAEPSVYMLEDKKYEGFRETVGGQCLEALFTSVGLLPVHKFSGIVLADEIREGLPLYWVSRYADFKASQTYLLKEFAKENGAPKNKPLLCLEIVDSPEQLTTEDRAFIDTYFTLLDPTSEAVIEFFDNAEQTLRDIYSAGLKVKNIKETWGESLMRLIEADHNEFKGQDVSTQATATIVASFTGACFSEVLKETMRNLVYSPLSRKLVETYNIMRGR